MVRDYVQVVGWVLQFMMKISKISVTKTDRSKPPKQRQNQIRLSHTLMTLVWKYTLKGGMAGMVIQVGLDLLLDGSILVAQTSPWDGPPSWLLSFWKCENLPILISLTYHQCSHVCSLGVYHGNGIPWCTASVFDTSIAPCPLLSWISHHRFILILL